MNQLFLQLVNGQNVVNDVIENQMGMAKSLAVRFMMTNINRSEDVLSAAYMGLVHAVNWIYDHPEKDFDPDRLGSLINTIIRRWIIDYLDHDTIIPIARRTISDHAERGSVLLPPKVFRWEAMKDFENYEILDNGYLQEQNTLEIRIELDNHLTDTEKTVLDLKLRGYNQYEIANMMKCSQPWVNLVVGEIRDKYTTLSVCEKWPVSLS